MGVVVVTSVLAVGASWLYGELWDVFVCDGAAADCDSGRQFLGRVVLAPISVGFGLWALHRLARGRR